MGIYLFACVKMRELEVENAWRAGDRSMLHNVQKRYATDRATKPNTCTPNFAQNGKNNNATTTGREKKNKTILCTLIWTLSCMRSAFNINISFALITYTYPYSIWSHSTLSFFILSFAVARFLPHSFIMQLELATFLCHSIRLEICVSFRVFHPFVI